MEAGRSGSEVITQIKSSLVWRGVLSEASPAGSRRPGGCAGGCRAAELIHPDLRNPPPAGKLTEGWVRSDFWQLIAGGWGVGGLGRRPMPRRRAAKCARRSIKLYRRCASPFPLFAHFRRFVFVFSFRGIMAEPFRASPPAYRRPASALPGRREICACDWLDGGSGKFGCFTATTPGPV